MSAFPLMVSVTLTSAALGVGGGPAAGFVLQSGDRVVLLGGGLIEQERRFGFLEARLRRRWPDAAVVFRNLGWAGDTARGRARTSGYQNPDGFARLIKEVQDQRPTVLLLGYGLNESFDGPAGAASFREDYARLLEKLAPLKARMVLIAPPHLEDLGRPFPDPAEHALVLERYRGVIAELARERKLALVDLAAPLAAAKRRQPEVRLTTNGLAWTEAGAAVAARAMEEQLGLPELVWKVQLDAAGKLSRAEGTRVAELKTTKDGLSFQALDTLLPVGRIDHQLKVAGLRLGAYELRRDGKRLLSAPAEDWRRGLSLAHDDLAAAGAKLRQAILVNNDLFYRRWRPFNDHSRHWGFIGGDGKLYDAQIEAQEKVIAALTRPTPHQFDIVRTGDEQ